MIDETERYIPEVVPFRAAVGTHEHDETSKTICFALFATAAAGNCAEVERLFPRYAPDDMPVPHRSTIVDWARDHQWRERTAELWRSNKQMGLVELQRLTVGSAFVAAKVLHEMLTGADTRELSERILSAKLYELAFRTMERIPALASVSPPADVKHSSEMSREEEEANAKAAMIQRKTAR